MHSPAPVRQTAAAGRAQELGFAPVLRGPAETAAFLASDWDINATLIAEAKVNLG